MNGIADGEKPGFGLGLRLAHYGDILAGDHQVEWFEALTENHLGLPGQGPGPAFEKLLKIRTSYPIVLHGVSLSLGGTDPLNNTYLNAVAELIQAVEPLWVSDHLCWTGVHGRNSHDLLPLPYSEETVRHVVARIQKAQDAWRRPILVENVSSYFKFAESEMSEWEFVGEVVRRSGCELLFDVNNVYVSARNNGFDPRVYLQHIPWSRVRQIHLAGHRDKGHIVIDTHDAPVREEVWSLYAETIRQVPGAATMIEWDDRLPGFGVLEAELLKAKEIAYASNPGFTCKTASSVTSGTARDPAPADAASINPGIRP